MANSVRRDNYKLTYTFPVIRNWQATILTWKYEPSNGIVPSHILDHDWLLESRTPFLQHDNPRAMFSA
jgi:hypothetical protein